MSVDEEQYKVLLGHLEKAKKGGTIDDLIGAWKFLDHPNPLVSFDVMAPTKELDGDVADLCTCDLKKHSKDKFTHAVAEAFSSPVAAIAVVRAPSAVWSGCTTYKCCMTDDPARYYLVLHENGIIKIVTPEDVGMCTMISLASADSKPGCCSRFCHPLFDILCCCWTDLYKNLKHRETYGCFCFAYLKEAADGTISFERYNRWGDDVDYLYTAEKVSPHPSSDAKAGGAPIEGNKPKDSTTGASAEAEPDQTTSV
jgi:hypothetical protein